jgi:hypothetical protein
VVFSLVNDTASGLRNITRHILLASGPREAASIVISSWPKARAGNYLGGK